MKQNYYRLLCIEECSIETSKTGEHSYYSAGEFVELSEAIQPSRSFIGVTKEQYKQLSSILKDIAKERKYRDRQYLKIKESHPKSNWKAEQRINGSVQEERSMKRRFNKLVSEIARKEIEVLPDWKTDTRISW